MLFLCLALVGAAPKKPGKVPPRTRFARTTSSRTSAPVMRPQPAFGWTGPPAVAPPAGATTVPPPGTAVAPAAGWHLQNLLLQPLRR